MEAAAGDARSERTETGREAGEGIAGCTGHAAGANQDDGTVTKWTWTLGSASFALWRGFRDEHEHAKIAEKANLGRHFEGPRRLALQTLLRLALAFLARGFPLLAPGSSAYPAGKEEGAPDKPGSGRSARRTIKAQWNVGQLAEDWSTASLPSTRPSARTCRKLNDPTMALPSRFQPPTTSSAAQLCTLLRTLHVSDRSTRPGCCRFLARRRLPTSQVPPLRHHPAPGVVRMGPRRCCRRRHAGNLLLADQPRLAVCVELFLAAVGQERLSEGQARPLLPGAS